MPRRSGFREYGSLAEHQMREFGPKALRSGAPAYQPFEGNAEIGSLTPLDCRYEAVCTLRTALTNGEILRLAALVPIVPRTLTIMPLEQLLKSLFGMSLQDTYKKGRP